MYVMMYAIAVVYFVCRTRVADNKIKWFNFCIIVYNHVILAKKANSS